MLDKYFCEALENRICDALENIDDEEVKEIIRKYFLMYNFTFSIIEESK